MLLSAQTVALRLRDKAGWKEESLELGAFAQCQGRLTTPISNREPTSQLSVATGNGNTAVGRNQKQAQYQQRNKNLKIMAVPQHGTVCVPWGHPYVATPSSCSSRDVTPRLGHFHLRGCLLEGAASCAAVELHGSEKLTLPF